MRLQRTAIVLQLLSILLITSVLIAQEATETPEGSTPEVTSEFLVTPEMTAHPQAEAIPPEIAAHMDDWALPNRDYANTRAVPISTINSGNVDEIEVVWSFSIPGRAAYGAAASAPVIVAGVVYFQDLASNVFAIDLYTGEVLWERLYDRNVIGPNGVGIGYGKVFAITGVDTFAALDMMTGQEVWVRTTGDRPTGAFQPVAYGGYAYYTTQAGVAGSGENSFRGYQPGTSGHIYALDPDTGEIAWEFQTVEEGFWGNPEVNSGAGIWFPPAIDTATGLTFWGTGNPAPFPGTFDFPNATSRPEPNLYANSLIALQHDSGELIWYNYVNPNDLFDLDLQISPILATVTIGGIARNVVIASGKLGYIIAMDRETGATLWNTPVGIHQNDDIESIPPGEAITVYPGVLGGVETPMAYADGIIYAPVLNLPTEYDATAFGSADGSEAVAAANERTPIGQGTSELVALDAVTGQVLWSHEFDSDMYGGATVVSDLVFVATFDGMIYALNRASGEIVWSYQAPAGINAWPAVADNTIVWAAGFGNNPSLIALRLPLDQGQSTPEAEATQTPEATQDAEATAETTPGADAAATAQPETEPDDEQASSEFISVDAENQTVTLTVIAAYDSTNGGLNFNGYANGGATYVVPEGWTVNVNFENRADLPHSAMIVPQDAVDQQQLPDPVFEGAAIGDPYAGVTGTAEFSFTASEVGTYALACGVPGHAASGHWIVFEVGSSDAQPAFQTGS
ncbi:MAG: PQQ-binding-like beta-propeller repeat protein [Anaerolinea sp.]|nr:PQQ-binding-like beta-propeller repeat protein [Anaerolinea sp.]